MRPSQALLEALLLERQYYEVDKAWVAGVKKAWQQLVRQTKSNIPRDLTHPADPLTGIYFKLDEPVASMEATAPLANELRDRLNNAVRFVERLREDLLINKGFWIVPQKVLPPSRGTSPEWQAMIKKQNERLRAKTKIVRGLEKVIKELMGAANWMLTVPMRTYRNHPLKTEIESMLEALEIALENADKLLENRIWKTLRSLVKKGGGTVAMQKDPVENEITMGRARIIFLDTPMDPYEAARGQRVAHGLEKWRGPGTRKKIVKVFEAAFAKLKRRGLGAVWYGPMFVAPETHGYKFQYTPTQGKGGKVKTRAAAVYSHADKLIFYSKVNVGNILHELGHRYYYKVMKKADRDEFDRWFGKVKAVSMYGSRNPAEDFAELFEEYVRGKMNLAPEQVRRFERVLRHKTKVDEPATLGTVKGAVENIRGVPVYIHPSLRDSHRKITDALKHIDRVESVLHRVFQRGARVVPTSPSDRFLISLDSSTKAMTLRYNNRVQWAKSPYDFYMGVGMAYWMEFAKRRPDLVRDFLKAFKVSGVPSRAFMRLFVEYMQDHGYRWTHPQVLAFRRLLAPGKLESRGSVPSEALMEALT